MRAYNTFLCAHDMFRGNILIDMEGSIVHAHNSVLRTHNTILRSHNTVLRTHNVANSGASTWASHGFGQVHSEKLSGQSRLGQKTPLAGLDPKK